LSIPARENENEISGSSGLRKQSVKKVDAGTPKAATMQAPHLLREISREVTLED
jgi:hypothetical protein